MNCLWLDPSPAVREFVGSFANAPVREPEIDTPPKLSREAALEKFRALASKRGGEAMRMKALKDAHKRGETMRERYNRQRREHYQAHKEKYAARYRARKARLAGVTKL